MTLTLAQARDVVEDHLDDASNARWTTAQIDVALQMALDQCLNDYITAGGERFDTLVSITSTTGGIVALTSYDPLVIQGVSVLWGNRYYPIQASRPEERGLADGTARTVQVRYVPRMTIPTTTSHKLVGTGATAYNSWDAFDHWVCVHAAMFCAIKDAELRQELMALENRLGSSVLNHARMPKQRPFPRAYGMYGDHLKWVRDTWTASSKQLALVIL